VVVQENKTGKRGGDMELGSPTTSKL